MVCFASPNANSTEIPFPEFVGISSIEDCSASCAFNSCAGTGDCTCYCGFFKCKCQQNPQIITFEEMNIEIDQNQYKNAKDLAEILYNSNEEEGVKAYQIVFDIIDNIQNGKFDEIESLRNSFFLTMSHATVGLRDKINEYFSTLEIEDRV